MKYHVDLRGYTQIKPEPVFHAVPVLDPCSPHLPPRPSDSNAGAVRTAGQFSGWVAELKGNTAPWLTPYLTRSRLDSGT